MRAAGILLPVASLPGKYGIGTMGREALQFIDFLQKSGQRFWQILPLGPTGYGDSPYQSVSAFAGNPYLIDLDALRAEGLLKKEEYSGLRRPAGKVDYPLQQDEKMKVLRKAASRFFAAPPAGYAAFCGREEWLEGYAAYMTVRGRMGGLALAQWPALLRDFDDTCATLQKDAAAREEMAFWRFVQYIFYRQWETVKSYANQKGIFIIGDLPIYISPDSADLWQYPTLFQLDAKGVLAQTAGCPPDYFSPDGQFWGNPLYDWDAHRREDYAWWKRRMRHALRLYDRVRIDHFRGFAGYWAIPAGQETARGGHWETGPGIVLFESLRRELGELPIIAEDLGDITPDVRQLLKESGFPGMKVLQFAFGSDETNEYLPHRHIEKCVVYPGTHDNTTLKNWIQTEDPAALRRAKDYFGLRHKKELPGALLRAALSSVADDCVIPIADWLGLGLEGRVNVPNTACDNWTFQIKEAQLTASLASRIAKETKRYGRRNSAAGGTAER